MTEDTIPGDRNANDDGPLYSFLDHANAKQDVQDWMAWARNKIKAQRSAIADLARDGQAKAAQVATLERTTASLKEQVAAYDKVISARAGVAYLRPGAAAYTGAEGKTKCVILEVIVGVGVMKYKVGYWSGDSWCSIEVPDNQVSADPPVPPAPTLGFAHPFNHKES